MTTTKPIRYTKSLVKRFDDILSRGLCSGVGERDGQMCIEAAICATLDLPHGDNPQCVAESVRAFKITLNDSNWSSPQSRAAGLRDVGLAQLGSRGVVNDVEFASRLAIKCVRVLIPEMLRLSKDAGMLAAIPACEAAETLDAAGAARAAARAARAASYAVGAASDASDASYAASYAARAARAASDAAGAASYAVGAASYAARAAAGAARAAAGAARAAAPDYFLKRIAALALEVLIELKSPGVTLLNL